MILSWILFLETFEKAVPRPMGLAWYETYERSSRAWPALSKLNKEVAMSKKMKSKEDEQ